MDATCFRLLTPALAPPVAEAQLNSYQFINVTWSYDELKVDGLDFLLLANEPDGIWQIIALGKGNRVAVFRYGGREKLSEHIDLLAHSVE